MNNKQLDKISERHRQLERYKENNDLCSTCKSTGVITAIHKLNKCEFSFGCDYCSAAGILGLRYPTWNKEREELFTIKEF